MRLMNNGGDPIEILLVEDDPGDVTLMKEVLQEAKLSLNLSVVGDGIEALDLLRNENGFEDEERPDIILLDLNMPRMDGRELLTLLKDDPDLVSIPVVVLTTSNADSDIAKSYTNGAACYVTKPVGLDQFAKVVESLESFWFTVVKFPPRD